MKYTEDVQQALDWLNSDECDVTFEKTQEALETIGQAGLELAMSDEDLSLVAVPVNE